MERVAAPSIAAEHDREPPPRVPRRRAGVPVRGVVRVVEAEILVGQQGIAGLLRVELDQKGRR